MALPTIPFRQFPALLKEHAALLVLWIAYFLIRLQFFEAPMERDEGIYAYFGQLMLDGKTPYIDFYEHRLPGIFYVYAVMVFLFGTFKGLALGITLLNLVSIGFVYALARDWWGKPAGIWAAASLAVLSISPEISGFTRQSEHIVVFFMLWGFWLLAQALKSNRWGRFVAAGVLICLSMLTKPNGVFFIVAGGLWIVLFYYLKKEYKNLFKFASIYSVAVFATFGLLLLLMVKNGTVDEMFYWSVTFAADYSTYISFSDGLVYFKIYWDALAEYYWWLFILSGLGLLAIFFAKPTEQENKGFKIAATWLFFLFSFLTITPGYRFYGHYWLMWAPGIAFAVGALAGVAASRLPENWMRWLLHLVLAAVFLIHFNHRAEYYTNPNMLKISRRAYSTNPFPEALAIGKYLKKKVKKGDQLAVIGSEPELYIYTDCRAFSRHAYFTYMVMDTTKAEVLKWQEEFKSDFEKQKPRFLVAFQQPMSLSIYPNANLEILDWVAQKINTDYKRIGIVDKLGTMAPKYMWIETADSSFATYTPQYLPNEGKYNAQIFERKE